MNAVEIEQAVSELCEAPFDRDEFPYQFLEAFGEKQTTIKRLRKGSTNKSDIPGGLLLRNNIHLLGSEPGQAGDDLRRLVASPETCKHKAKFALATDGTWVEAENLIEGETLACSLKDLPDHFGFFLALAGIATIKQIRDNAFDIKATGRMNRLYVELQQNNPDWDTAERREELNHFFARLIFCFFAEDTGIFHKDDIFTNTIKEMSDPDASNTHEIISEVFRAMNIEEDDREGAGLPRYTSSMPYVNGGLFEGSTECPRFTKMARSYFIHIGGLDWTKINPDIFGSMIQAVAEDEERGELGMHYTSVPNILKVLNPLFLDELRQQLEDAEDNKRKLLNLRNRMARIRVFDPACGSGNFLVIAYKEMRGIETEINRRRSEADRASGIPLTNFRGIEVRSFAAEVARLALVIAKFQSDLESRGPQLALFDALPLSKSNWITRGNALRIDWTELCPPKDTNIKFTANDLFEAPLDQPEIDFDNEGGELFICGNPPFTGTRRQTPEQKSDLEHVYSPLTPSWGNADYVSAWFIRAAQFNLKARADYAFVTTSSLCQGQQVPIIWPILFGMGLSISFARRPFHWKNLAKNNAGVTVIIVGLSLHPPKVRWVYDEEGALSGDYVNPYLTRQRIPFIEGRVTPMFTEMRIELGVYYSKSASLLLSRSEKASLLGRGLPPHFVRSFIGSSEFIKGKSRYCLWISNDNLIDAEAIPEVKSRIESTRSDRLATKDSAVNKLAARPHQFREFKGDEFKKVFIPLVSSERREYFPVGLVGKSVIPSNKACYSPGAPTSMLAILASKLHMVWIRTICGRLRDDLSYSSRMGWNTFPIPKISPQSECELEDSASKILIARESYWPATIADMYDPDRMDAEFAHLREAHEHNDELLERIYIGRRFKNDTERLEKLFEMYEAAVKKEASV